MLRPLLDQNLGVEREEDTSPKNEEREEKARDGLG